ncbi:VOC family protein [Tunturiibacter lichenicola]|uniref:VOC family protein n=1 Tax=Tunturiibacter lichenicola TaxID=2051959 RepID=UPI0021B3FDEC|nr:VOC family protein [Edaphobacter lichenicola]
MLKLNHINLSVSDVPALSDYFERCFNFKIAERRGSNKFAVLVGEDDFALVLMHGKDVTPTSYPAMFHVGFILADETAVRATHQRMIQAGYVAPEPERIQRGGPPTFGFYHPAPGGILVEVSAQIAE